MKLVSLIVCTFLGSNLALANDRFGVNDDIQTSDESLFEDTQDENMDELNFEKRPRHLAAGVYHARSRNPRLCDLYVVPAFSGRKFIGYDATALGTCARQTVRFTCRNNFCETNVDRNLHISIISSTSFVFSNGNERLSDVFEL